MNAIRKKAIQHSVKKQNHLDADRVSFFFFFSFPKLFFPNLFFDLSYVVKQNFLGAVEAKAIQDVVRIFSSGTFYFSYSYDLTNSVQRSSTFAEGLSRLQKVSLIFGIDFVLPSLSNKHTLCAARQAILVERIHSNGFDWKGLRRLGVASHSGLCLCGTLWDSGWEVWTCPHLTAQQIEGWA